MQAVNLKLDMIKKELKSFGLNTESIDFFRIQTVTLLIKLRKIPEQVIPIMETAAPAHNVKMLLSRIKQNKQGLADAIIAGSEMDLLNICAVLKQKMGDPAMVGQLIEKTINGIHKKKPDHLSLGRSFLPLGRRTLVMGILNVTPDSFSDGGQFDHLEKALIQAYKIAEEGADIIDIGGESTRPGHEPVSPEEELKRVMPVITALKNDHSFKLPLSIDTYKAVVAETALKTGVEMLNDVWGLKGDSALGRVAAEYGIPICLMHNRHSNVYEDLIPDIIAELEESVNLAHQAGIEDDRIIIDPGIGFGKNLEQNLEVMIHLREFCSLGYPLLLGTSRKSMIGKTLDLPVDKRLEGTAATVAYGISAGADIIRVHDVSQMRNVAIMTDAMVRR